jgi:heterodisulfide reductase subunit C
MEYTPREVIAALRAGILDRVLRSNTIWLCTSCYYCTVRCPSGVKLTDVMYELKRLAVEFGLVEKKAKAPVVSRLFVDLVDKNGRISEVSLVGKFMLKMNPFGAVGMMPRAWKLLIRGRMPLIPHRIKRMSELKKCASTIPEISGLHAGAEKVEKAAA